MAVATLAVALALAAGAWLVTRFAAGEPQSAPQVLRLAGVAPDTNSAPGPAGILRVITLNAAHGRSDGFHQALLGSKRIRRNLDAIAEVLRREAPHVVALQEVDAPSLWSGRFDHVRHVAERGGFGWAAHGRHVLGPGVAYGTAVLSRGVLESPMSVTFKPSPPTFSKGFLLATLQPPGRPELSIDVVSVHLDFARASVRRRQADTLIDHLRERGRPLIVMGDFNCDWLQPRSPMRDLAAALELQTWQPEAEVITFPTAGRRIDWILVSRELTIQRHEVLEDVVSDHRGVVADIGLPPPASATDSE